MNKFRLFLAAIMVAGLWSGCKPQGDLQESVVKEAWDDRNNPIAKLGLPPVKADAIPAAGRMSQDPWPGYYWATYRMGIAYRWQDYLQKSRDWFRMAEYDQYLFEPPSASEVRDFDEARIGRLSPAEKYDIWTGKLDLPLTRQTIRGAKGSVNNGKIPRWFGICHGWAPAAGLIPEPGEVLKVRGVGGQCVTFYRSDIKALISQAYGDAKYKTGFLGGRCNRDPNDVRRLANGRIADPSCRDVNAGGFHVAVTQLVAKQVPFVADVTYSSEVWNQPIVGYEFAYSNRRAFSSNDPNYQYRAAGHATPPKSLVDVKLKLFYTVESLPSLQPVRASNYVADATYHYTLELDAGGRIIGGEWDNSGRYPVNDNQTRRPDFIWLVKTRPTLEGNLSFDRVMQLASLSRQGRGDCGTTAPAEPTEPVAPPTNTDDSANDDQQPDPIVFEVPSAPDMDPLPDLPTTLSQPTTGNNGSGTDRWVNPRPPRNANWRPSLDLNQLSCGKRSGRDACEEDNDCGWSATVNHCLYIDHGICSEYPDRPWCLVTDGCRWVDQQGRSTRGPGRCAFKP